MKIQFRYKGKIIRIAPVYFQITEYTSVDLKNKRWIYEGYHISDDMITKNFVEEMLDLTGIPVIYMWRSNFRRMLTDAAIFLGENPEFRGALLLTAGGRLAIEESHFLFLRWENVSYESVPEDLEYIRGREEREKLAAEEAARKQKEREEAFRAELVAKQEAINKKYVEMKLLFGEVTVPQYWEGKVTSNGFEVWQGIYYHKFFPTPSEYQKWYEEEIARQVEQVKINAERQAQAELVKQENQKQAAQKAAELETLRSKIPDIRKRMKGL